MADILSPEQRSRNMSAIRSKNTKPEIYFRKLLFARGYRYRISEKSVPGHPDIFLASSSGVQICIYAKVKAGVLAKEI